jgi:ribonuclease P/MRP protein subunit POP5
MLQEILDIIIIIWISIITILYFKSYKFKIKIIRTKKDLRSKRYIIFSILEDYDVSREDIELCIKNSLKELLGKVWLEISNPKVIIYDKDKKEGIISTNRVGYKAVLASLPFCKGINNKKFIIFSRKVTGSLKRARKEIGLE